MTVAKNGNTVRVHYTGKLTDGQVFDTSEGRDTLEFTLGTGQMIPGFEKAVEGMQVGEKVTTSIPADEAYGLPNPEMMIELPLENVPKEINPEPGMQLSLQNQDGKATPVIVKDITETSIVLDANHPLAGKDLVFDIELVEVN
ncbi:MAG: peptidylprolyl isomerase [Cyclobacteriaceae bacterium]